MKELNKHKVGLIIGIFTSFFHLLWVLLVATGLGQAFMDWIYDLHLLTNPFVVSEFELGKAIILVLITFLGGYLSGWTFAALWNKAQKRK